MTAMTTRPTFAPTLDAPTRRIDSSAWGDIYVVGDVYGCRGSLERLLDELGPSDDDLVVFVGDLA